MRSVTIAVEADRHLHLAQLLTSVRSFFQRPQSFRVPPFAPCRKVPSIITRLGAERLVAVLPMQLAQEAGLGQCLLHSYGSFQEIFTRPQGNHTRSCPAMGFAIGVCDLSARRCRAVAWPFSSAAYFSKASCCPRRAFALSILSPWFFEIYLFFIYLLTDHVIMAEVTIHFLFSYPPSLLGRCMSPLFGWIY